MKLLAQGRCFCIVKNNNDEYFLVGKEYGCDVTAMVANTGTAMGDSNGYEVTLSAIEAEAPYKLQSSVVTGCKHLRMCWLPKGFAVNLTFILAQGRCSQDHPRHLVL